MTAVAISPSDLTIRASATEILARQFQAIVTFSDGATASADVLWSSAQPSLATVDASGLAKILPGTPGGSAVLTAKAGAKSATATLTIQSPPVSVEFDPASYVGVGTSVRIRVFDGRRNTDSASISTLQTTIASRVDDRYEPVALKETGVATGIFEGTVALARLFGDEGKYRAPVSQDGNVAIYAEGGVAEDQLTAAYSDGFTTLRATASFVEPTSTVTGIVRTSGVAAPGALVSLTAGTNFLRETVTRSDGSYAFHDVPSGTYWLIAKAKGAVIRTLSVKVP